MKKLFSLVLSLAVVLSLSSCQGEEIKTKSLYDRGLELIGKIDMLAESEEYISMMSGSLPISEAAAEIGKEEFSSPKETYVLSGIDDILIKNLTAETDISEEIKEILKKKMAPVLPSQINAFGGVINLAVSNVLIENSTFISNEITETKTYLYKYTDMFSFMVTFSPGEENIVTATANIVINENLGKCSSVEELAEFFEGGLSLEGIGIEKLN